MNNIFFLIFATTFVCLLFLGLFVAFVHFIIVSIKEPENRVVSFSGACFLGAMIAFLATLFFYVPQ